MSQIDIIRHNDIIRNAIKARIDELNLSYNDIIKDAKKYNVSLSKSALSTYFNGVKKRGLTHRQVLWLGTRYNLTIKVSCKRNTNTIEYIEFMLNRIIKFK